MYTNFFALHLAFFIDWISGNSENYVDGAKVQACSTTLAQPPLVLAGFIASLLLLPFPSASMQLI